MINGFRIINLRESPERKTGGGRLVSSKVEGTSGGI